jgi:YesN/AraC family two-component response regulator
LNCLISQTYFENILLKHFDRTVFFSSFLTQAFYTMNSSQPMLALDTSESTLVRTVFSTAIVEQVNRAPLFETAVNSMILDLMVELLRIYMRSSDSQHYQELGNNKLSDILGFISDNCATVTLRQIAEEFHFNPNYLSRLMKSHTGQTFTQVLQATRLRKAALLLGSTDMSVSDITHFVGYQNFTHFYKLFRQSYGVSPAEYRATHLHAAG